MSLYGQEWKWAINAEGNHQGSDASQCIDVDHNGNMYIAGYFKKTLTLGEFSLTNPSDYWSKIYIAKIDSAGIVKWLKELDIKNSYDDGIDIVLDDNDNIYITGTFESKIFAAKYDQNGNILWLNNLKNEYSGYGSGIALDAYNNIYVMGRYGNYLGGAFLAKLDYRGETVWIELIESTCNTNGVKGSKIAVDAIGNSYVTGTYSCDTISVGGIKLSYSSSWRERAFFAKFNPNGKALWAKTTSNSTGGNPQITLNSLGEIVVGGYFHDNIVMDEIYLEGGYEVASYLFKISTEGNLLWGIKGGHYKGVITDLRCDYDNNIYTSGNSFGNYGGTEMDFHLEKYDTKGNFLWNEEVKYNSAENSYGIDLDNYGNCYVVGRSAIKGVYEGGLLHDAHTIFVAKLNTNSTTTLRTQQPVINGVYAICQGNPIPELQAAGENLIWFNDIELTHAIEKGPRLNQLIRVSDTVYVTQTKNEIISWPKPVIVHYSEIKNFQIERQKNDLIVPKAEVIKWYLNDSLIAENINTLTADTTGNFRVTISDNFCSATDTISIDDIILSAEENVKSPFIRVYPNPVQSFLEISNSNATTGPYDILIRDVNGKQLYYKNSLQLQENIDVRFLNPGVYLLIITKKDKEPLVTKFFKN